MKSSDPARAQFDPIYILHIGQIPQIEKRKARNRAGNAPAAPAKRNLSADLPAWRLRREKSSPQSHRAHRVKQKTNHKSTKAESTTFLFPFFVALEFQAGKKFTTEHTEQSKIVLS
jgi:hypothetical protein